MRGGQREPGARGDGAQAGEGVLPVSGEPETGNTGRAFHPDLRLVRRAEFGPGFPSLRRAALLPGYPGTRGRRPPSAPPGYPGPLLSPAVAANDVAQAQHRIHPGPRPVHSPSLQPRFHHQLVGAFNGPAPDGPAPGLKDRVLHLVFPLFQVGQGSAQVSFLTLDQDLQASQYRSGALMFETVQLLPAPFISHRSAFPKHPSAQLRHVLGSMGKVEDPHAPGTMKVPKPLNPFGAVGHQGHLAPFTHPPPVGLHHRPPGKVRRAGQPGKGGDPAQDSRLLPRRLVHFSDHQRLHLGPFSPHQGNHRGTIAPSTSTTSRAEPEPGNSRGSSPPCSNAVASSSWMAT